MGKIILLLFTNPSDFLKGAVLDPLLMNLAKMGANIQRKLMEIGAYLNPMYLFNEQGRDDELNRIISTQYDRDNPLSDQAIQKKYPGFFYDDKGLEGGLLGGMGDTETGKNLQKLQEMTTEELNLGNEKTDKVIEQTKEAGVAVGDLEDKVIIGNESQQKTAENTTELLKLAEAAAAAASFDKQQADIASEIAQDYRDQCVEKNSDYEFKTTMGSQAIEKAAKDKEKEAKDERLRKAGLDKEGNVIITGLSPEAQKRLNEAIRMKDPSQNGPIAGGREGTNVNPIATGDMGQYYESERYRTGTGAAIGEECYQQDKAEYYNYATETREGMEIYSKAIAESEKWGTKVHDEWKKIHSLASETESKADKIDSAFCQTLQSSEEVQAAGTDMADNFDTVATCVDTLAATMKNAVDNFSRHEKYLASIMKQASYIKTPTGATKYPGMAAAAAKMAGASLSPGEVDAAANAMYKITFGDGTSKTQGLDPTSYKHLSDMRARGELYRGKTILSIKKMAKGGIIGEKIFGIGESGQQYMFGESGPETVTPGVGGTVNNGGGSTFNITINASDTGDIERQLKPAILRMLKESTARAGIV